ncbi:unnamed protein product [Musa acuminata subsp. burmannicoides]
MCRPRRTGATGGGTAGSGGGRGASSRRRSAIPTVGGPGSGSGPSTPPWTPPGRTTAPPTGCAAARPSSTSPTRRRRCGIRVPNVGLPSRINMLSGSPSEKGLRNGGRDGCGRTHLYLNVYDLTPINKYLYWFGLGVFHSGIEVHGQEYGFGAHDYPSSGVFEVEPKSCPGFIFRRSVWLGTTDMSRSEFRILIEDLAGKYHGDTYNLIIKNCNHFTDEVCMHLTGKSIPGWVNRLARLGSFFRCIIPENIRVSAVGQLPTHPTCFEDEFDSFSSSSIEDSDEEDADHHLVKRPNIEFVHSSDEPLRLARDVM